MILLFIAQLSNIKHISARSFCREDRFIITCNDNVLAPLVEGGNRSDIGVMKVFVNKGISQDHKPVQFVFVYTCTVPYLCSSIITVKYIRLRSDLIPRTPKVYRGADDQSYQTWLLLHSTMQCPTVTVQIIDC